MNFYPYNHENVVITDGDLCVLRNRNGRLCGYCSFPADQLPKEWHGDYSADALNYLAIHGGLTYASVQGGDDVARYAASRAAYAAIPEPAESLSLDERLDAYSARRRAADAALLTVPYTHVVFGFDCAHYRDEEDYRLSDPQHVLGLARQMRQQIVDYLAVLPAWHKADTETRIAMVDEIRQRASTPVEMGFSGLIGMLAGAPQFGTDTTTH